MQADVISSQKQQIASTSKMEALGRMAAGIAYEINNPLTIVLGQVSQIKSMAKNGIIDVEKYEAKGTDAQKMCDWE